jgi:putative ABC transport system permease protein
MVGYGDFAVLLAHGNLLFKAPSDGRSAMRAAIGRDEALVSESFAIKQGRNVGDVVILPTRAGSTPFRIAAVYYDYSNDRGSVILDHATFVRHFANLPPTGLRIYLKAGTDADAVKDGMLSALGDRYKVFVSTNASLRREIMRVFDNTFAITYALEIIAVVVAVMGIAATLLTLILERRKELAILRLLGTDRRQIRNMVVFEAMLMGAASQGTGIAVGMVLSLILIYVINVQSFGWTIQFHVPVLFLVQMSVVVALATAISGIYPARCACAFEAVEQVAEE